MNKLAVYILLSLSFISLSCATLLKGHSDDITVISEPAGAKVSVNGEEKGMTPVTFTVPSKEDLKVYIAKDGYKPEELTDPATTRWGYEAFSFVEWVVPVFIDMGTGAAWGHDQLTLTTHLESSPQASPAAAPSASAQAAPSAEASPVANASPAPQASPEVAGSPVAQASPSGNPSPAAAAAESSPAATPAAAATASGAQSGAGAISAR